jgi:hypothetical protein
MQAPSLPLSLMLSNLMLDLLVPDFGTRPARGRSLAQIVKERMGGP